MGVGGQVVSSISRCAHFSLLLHRLDLGQSNIAYERMNAAISCFSHDVSAIEQAIGDGREYILHGTHLRHILLDSFSPTSGSTHSIPLQRADEVKYVSHETLEHSSRVPKVRRGAFKDDMQIMSWAKRYMRHNPIRVEGDPVLPLNTSQVRAVATMIAEDMSLVQGVRHPPHLPGILFRMADPTAASRYWKNENHHRDHQAPQGELDLCLLHPSSHASSKKHFAVVHPILVCTYTNVAVDNLVEGFVAAGLDPVRIGYGQTKSTFQKYSLESKTEKHPLYAKYKLASENSKGLDKELERTRADLQDQERGAPSGKLSRLRSYVGILDAKRKRFRSDEQALYQQIQTELLTNADVVCFPTSCKCKELINAVRYALPASVLGLGR